MDVELAEKGRKIIKDLLAQCNDKQQFLFKCMYSPKDTTLDINVVVDNMDEGKIDMAIFQCRNTVRKNQEKKADLECEIEG